MTLPNNLSNSPQIVSIHTYDNYLLNLQARQLCIKYKNTKDNKFNRKGIEVNEKMGNHSVL